MKKYILQIHKSLLGHVCLAYTESHSTCELTIKKSTKTDGLIGVILTDLRLVEQIKELTKCKVHEV